MRLFEIQNPVAPLLLVVVLVVCPLPFANATNATNDIPALRPFYIIGHEADTLAKANDYFAAGANGIECNVDTLAGHPETIRIGHGPCFGVGPVGINSVPLADFLKGLHRLALVHTNFCLVYFDCKTLVATPELGQALLEAIRSDLNGPPEDGVALNVIISVGTLTDTAIFSNIAGQLGPREAIMVDGVSRPGEISHFFDTTTATNLCFSDGTVPFNTCLGHFQIYWALKKAIKMRDRDHKFSFVGTWTVNSPWLMKDFLQMGVDAIAVDKKFIWYNFSWENLGNGLRSLRQIVQKNGPRYGVRLATREDLAFQYHK